MCAVAIISGLAAGYLSYATLLHGDAIGYRDLARSILHRGTFADAEGNVFNGREPLYPLFLAGLYFFFGESVWIVFAAQIAVFMASVALVFRLGEECFDRRVACIGALGFALFPPAASHTSQVLTETLFTFFILLGAYLFLRGVRTSKSAFFAASGLALGAGTLTRALGIIAFGAFLFGWAMVQHGPHRFNVKKAILFLMAFLVLLFPWTLRNRLQFGIWQVLPRSGGGLTLYVRAYSSLMPPRDIAAYIVSSLTGDFFAQKIFPGFPGLGERAYTPPMDEGSAWQREHRAVSAADQDAYLSGTFFTVVKSHPVAYSSIGFAELLRLYSPMLGTSESQHLFTGTHPEFPSWAKGFAVASLRIFWFLFVVIGFWSLWHNRDRFGVKILGMFIVLYSGTLAAFFVVPRYALPIYPFVFLGFAAALVPKLMHKERLTVSHQDVFLRA